MIIINSFIFKKEAEIDPDSFIMQFAMTAGETLTLPLYTATGYDCTINWGDGSTLSEITRYNDADLSHTYSSAGIYNVSISGVCKGFQFTYYSKSRLNLIGIVQWGDVGMTTTYRSFYYCSNSVSLGDFENYPLSTIGQSAFYGWNVETSVTIPNSVTSIEDSAFENWTSATGLVIPNSIATINRYAFANWTSATSLTIPNSVTLIGESAFEGWASTTSLTIPNSVTLIGESAFKGWASATSLIIPNSVTSISVCAFEEWENATSLTISNSLTSIEENTFYGWSSATSLTIPSSVTTIGPKAFSNWTSATSLVISSSVTSISNYAFYKWTSANLVITCNATTPPTLGGSGVFDRMNASALIKVPAASLTAYKTATYWSEYASRIVSQ